MTVSIRTAGPDDAATIHRFIYELALYEELAHKVEATAEILKSQLQPGNPLFECLLAEVDSEPVGFALFHPTYSTFTGKQGMYLVDLYVSSSVRRLGIGRLLFSSLIDIARARDYARIEWQVIEGNDKAEDFYRSLGAWELDNWSSWRIEPQKIKAPLSSPTMLSCPVSELTA